MENMYESYLFFKYELDMAYIWNMPIHQEKWTEEDVIKYDEQLKLIAADELKERELKNNDNSALREYSPLDKCLMPCTTRFEKPCGAGFNYCTVTADGNIYPCHQFYFTDEDGLKTGDVWNGIDEVKNSIFYDYSPKDMNCSKLGCTNYNCYRCIAENYIATGTLLNCELGPRCKMTTSEKNIINKLKRIIEND